MQNSNTTETPSAQDQRGSLDVAAGSASDWLETLERDLRYAFDYSDPHLLGHKTIAAVNALRSVKGWLRGGSMLKATDANGAILELLPDGTIHGGLTITGEPNMKGQP